MTLASILLLTASFDLGGQALGYECSGVVPTGGDGIRAEIFVSGFEKPVDIAAPAGDTERLFVVEQGGLIRIARLADADVLAEPFLDFRGRVLTAGPEQGLLGIAFHPNFRANGHVYVNYIRRGACGSDGETVVSRVTVSPQNPDRADPGTEKVLLSFCHPDDAHKGGKMEFGPLDGYLYIACGDGATSGTAQDPGLFLGKILRIDVDHGDPYSVPPSNPFVGNGNVRPEIWALGLRNPWRLGFDAETGDLYIADVGGREREEINFQPGASDGGANYEWERLEGTFPLNPGLPVGPGTLTGPLLDYPRTGTLGGGSVIGGLVYRGCRMPDLHGTYFFADWLNNWVASFRVVDGEVTDLRDRTPEVNFEGREFVRRPSAFGTDGRGEIYVCNHDRGSVARLIPADTTSPVDVFSRGDANGDGDLDISDPVFTLVSLVAGGGPFPCEDAADVDDNGDLNLTDAVYSLGYLFRAGPAPAPPFRGCAADPSADELECPESNCNP